MPEQRVSPTGRRLPLATAVFLLAATLGGAGGTGAASFHVNSTAWNTTQGNGVMALPEALGLAAGNVMCLDAAEKAQVTGVSEWLFVPGPNCWTDGAPFQSGDLYADSIVFDSASFVFVPDCNGSAGSPPLNAPVVLDELDSITGPATLDGSTAIGSCPGILLNHTDNNTISRFHVVGFPAEGIVCRGCKGLTVEGSTIAGNSIGINAYGHVSSNPTGMTIGFPGDPVLFANSILGNEFEGVKVIVEPAFDNPADTDIWIQNNWIGDDGTVNDAGNGGAGIYLQNVRGGRVGGPGVADRNFVNFNNGAGIEIVGAQADGILVQNNFVGLDESGIFARGNTAGGIVLRGGASANLVRDNVIAGNGGPGIDITDEASDGNLVHGNRIGTTANGASARSNNGGIRITGGADATTIGSPSLADRNLVSGNTTHGIGIYNSGTTGTVVDNNWIGLNAAGTAALANSGDGVRIQEQATGSLIQFNTISGNGNDGVGIRHSGTNSHTVQLNDIGLLPSAAPMGNTASGVALLEGAASNSVIGNTIAGNGNWGVYIANSGTNANLVDDNEIGLFGAGNAGGGVILANGAVNNNVEDNVIGWNSGVGGVQLDGTGTTLNDVYRNRIGTNLAGTAAAPNSQGVTISNGATSNVIGGTSAALGNVISGNAGYGVGIWNAGTSGNEVRFNKIGTNAAANAALPNGAEGVRLALGSASSVLRDNVLSGNATAGVRLTDAGTSAALERNHIGVGSNPGTPLPNGNHGVWVAGAAGVVNLGTSPGTTNVIAHNGGAGLRAEGTGLAAFYETTIHDNAQLAIDLGGAGVTANDLLDADGGANGLLNMPVITSARVASTVNLTTRVKYHGPPSTQFRAHLFHNTQCDASRHGEAEAEPLASAPLTTDGSGNAEVTMVGTAIAGDILSALVTAFAVPSLTSELSTCRTVVDDASTLIFDDGFESGLYDAWSAWAP